jgi:hypothetical protein
MLHVFVRRKVNVLTDSPLISSYFRCYTDSGHEANGGRDLVVICGFGPVGQIVATLISSPAVGDAMQGLKFIAFDLNPKRVSESRAKG